MTALLANLTDDQRRAVEHVEGPLLILAAAGSGKTRVITRRIAHLLELGEPAWSILALTFTNKAAGEMRDRVNELLASAPERALRGLTITTFHSLCARLLRRYAPFMTGRPDWPITGDFTIYDADDQRALMKATIKAMDLDTTNWPVRTVLSAISEAKNALIDARQYEHDAADFYARTIALIYTRYAESLRAANAVDFDDLLLLTARLLREHDEVRGEINRRYRHLMIDEYQDTNHAQFVLSSMLIGGDDPAAPNIAVVGDPDQSIYGWRGADITNILEFEQRFPTGATIALGQNFRSTAPILACADALIQNNIQRKHKPLYTTRDGGGSPRVVLARDEEHEAQLVVEHCKALAGWDRSPTAQANAETEQAPLNWRDMAVMYRNNALSRVVEDAFRRAGIPYIVARGTAFFQREEVKDAIAYLRVVANPADEVSLTRIVNKPARAIGKTTIAAIQAFAARHSITMFEALKRGDEAGLAPRAAGACAKFCELIDGWTAGGSFMGATVPTTLESLADRVVRESGLEAHYRKVAEKNRTEAEEAKVDNLAEVVSSAARFDEEFDARIDEGADPAFDPFGMLDELMDDELDVALSGAAPSDDTEPNTPPDDEVHTPDLLARLRAYLESVSLIADADRVDPAQGAVTLMTLHAAKGLEFPVVSIVGLEEGTLPGQRAMESESEMEEERRLCFVGITRAMEHLTLSSARYRTHRGVSERTIPSRFLDELPTDHVEVIDKSDIAEGLGSAWGEPSRRLEPFDDVAPFDDDAAPRRRAGSPPFDDDIDQRPPEERLAEAKPRRRTAPRANQRSSTRTPRLKPGQRVRHPRFGEGTVQAVNAGMNARASIAFDQTGTKTLILQYAKLEIL
ncbi:MAG: UvrD-helicase domain-containing protein [Planctomycetota bacterium]